MDCAHHVRGWHLLQKRLMDNARHAIGPDYAQEKTDGQFSPRHRISFYSRKDGSINLTWRAPSIIPYQERVHGHQFVDEPHSWRRRGVAPQRELESKV